MHINDKKIIEGLLQAADDDANLGASTIKKYQDSIERFLRVTGVERLRDLKLEDFKAFKDKMRSKGVTRSYIGNVIAAMKWVIAAYNEKVEKIPGIDIKAITKPKAEKRVVNYLTDEEVTRLYEGIRSDNSKGSEIRKERFLALTMFLLQTGARIGETLSINRGDIDRERMEIPIIGKAEKPRDLFVTPALLNQLDKYLSMRKDNHPALFVALNGESRWAQTDVNRTFIRYRKLSGLGKRFTNHTMRHTFATRLMGQKVPLNTIQFLLGHSSPVVTMKFYIGTEEKEKAKMVMGDAMFAPLDG